MSTFGTIATDPRWREAIASIESRGSGDYAAIGPTHPSLGRALGRYQIMEANIAPWSREILGRAVSAQEFMQNPQLQDAIFDGKFGRYVQQYGPEGAAQAWIGGPGGVGKTGRTDSLGTSIGEYGQRFLQSIGAGGTSPSSMMQTATDNPAQAAAPNPNAPQMVTPPAATFLDLLSSAITANKPDIQPAQPTAADLMAEMARAAMLAPPPKPDAPFNVARPVPNDPLARGMNPSRYMV